MAEPHPAPEAAERVAALLGLGLRGGLVVCGVDGTLALLQRQQCYAVVAAADWSARAQEKILPRARFETVPLVVGPSADRLGERLGRPPVMVVGVRDRKLAAGIVAAAQGSQD